MAEDSIPSEPRATPYAWYVLAILFAVYILNFVDRQIVSILAEDIKRDLHLRDEDLGFLYGTAFGVFYALFGIPLGRLADNWHRVRLMTVGLTLWSAMTALSGLARSGTMLAGARIGVGVGEATASPAAYSLISDWFPRRLRATALAIYSAGIYVGGGLSLGIGGLIVKRWNAAYPDGGPLGLAGWQAAFLAVGVPGLLMAMVVATLREPYRGQSEGTAPPPPHPAPFRAFMAELLTIIPPFTLVGAARGGKRALIVNLVALAIIVGLVTAIHALGESLAVWTAIGIGAYAVFSWGSALKRRDAPTFALIIGNPAFLATVIAYSLNAFVAYTIGFWASPYAIRVLGISPAEAGVTIGGFAALSGFAGITLGGIIADKLRTRYPAGRLMVLLFGGIVPPLAVAAAFTSSSFAVFCAMIFAAQLLGSGALGAAAATTQDLVLPRMRGTATGTFFIGTTLVGLALGPYTAGRVSTLTGSLSIGVLSTLLVVPFGLIAGLIAYRLVPAAEANRAERARAAGEAI
ncbi:MAG: MFS transporter [Sphingomonas sp.]|jgi:MFS family permease